jgi:hypothetical protein
MESDQARIALMEAQLESWTAQLAELLAMTQAVEVAKDERCMRSDELELEHRAARKRLAKLDAEHAEKREAFEVGVESAWHELEN